MLTKYSVKRPFTVFVGVIIAIVFGAVALYSMTPDLMPSINAPYSVVMTSEPGASAEEVEKEVTEPLEQQLATLSKLNNISSVSADNVSVITLEFTDDVNFFIDKGDLSEAKELYTQVRLKPKIQRIY